MDGVIHSHFEDLRRKKAFEEKRNITFSEIAEQTGLAMTTLARISKNDNGVQNIRLSTINALCNYFDVPISELIEHRKD